VIGNGGTAVAASVFYWLRTQHGWPWPVVAVLSVLVLGPAMGVLLERTARLLDDVSHVLKIAARRRPVVPDRTGRGDHGAHRAERRGQDHDLQRGLRAAAAELGPGPVVRSRPRPPRPGGPGPAGASSVPSCSSRSPSGRISSSDVSARYVHRALEIASFVYLINRGQIALAGPRSELQTAELFRRYVTGQ
jgi:hypothetical protein